MIGPGAQYQSLLRIAGHDPTALEVLKRALDENRLPISGDAPTDDPARADPYQVDLALTVVYDGSAKTAPDGTTYSGLTPSQRGAFLVWAEDPVDEASPAFQRLLVSHIEVALLEAEDVRNNLQREMIRWALAPAWQSSDPLARALLLALWLTSNGAGIAEWTSTADLSANLLELAIGMQALLHEDIRAEQLIRLCKCWNLPGADYSPEVVALRLRSSEDILGAAPLALVRKRFTDEDLEPSLWRAAHRDLRFSLPQPSIRRHLLPLLQELLTAASHESVAFHDQDDVLSVPEPEREWQLVLEFGQSRSDFYPYVLDLAQRMPGYVQLLDEDRRLVHRISYQKREMRSFWRIWDYVQNWSTTRVYRNGQELEKWKVWPYSQYLH